jgi:hypothetical protein
MFFLFPLTVWLMMFYWCVSVPSSFGAGELSVIIIMIIFKRQEEEEEEEQLAAPKNLTTCRRPVVPLSLPVRHLLPSIL